MDSGSAALRSVAPDVERAFAKLQEVRPGGVHDEVLESPAVARFAEQFGVDVSVIDELPPGRTPVVTKLVGDSRRDEVVARVRDAVATFTRMLKLIRLDWRPCIICKTIT